MKSTTSALKKPKSASPLAAARSLVVVAALVSGSPVARAQSKAINGHVGVTGRGDVTNGHVIAGRKLANPAALPGASTQISGPPVATVAIDKQGNFSLPSLPDGDYAACVSTRLATVLSSCEWTGPGAHEFTVKNGSSPALDIKLAKGSPLRVHLDDPANTLVSQKNGKVPDLTVHVVSQAGRPIPAHVAGVGPTSRDYQLTIPFDSDLVVHMGSQSLDLGDEKGAPLTSPQIPVNHSSTNAATTRQITLKVLGAH